MNIQELAQLFAAGLALGLILSSVWDHIEKKLLLQKTKMEGDHILQEAQDKADSFIEERKKEAALYQEKKQALFDKQKEEKSLELRDLQAKIDSKLHKQQLKFKERESLLNKIKSQLKEIQEEKTDNIKQKTKLRSEMDILKNKKTQCLTERFSEEIKKIKESLKTEIIEERAKQIQKDIENKEKQDKQNLQKNAVFYLNMILNRFDRAYCPERGINPVSFKSNKILEKTIGPEKEHLREIEKACGVDILVNDEELQASVFGIDPVRRELGRMTLTKLLRKPSLSRGLIEKTVRTAKKELFAKIRRSGQNICRRLKLKNIHPEVQNMMGALRYRYSFAQNQHFHCEEVGWLCGLMNAELGLNFKSGQRAGMFHDIGKAMDHSIEGSHAVIGADFLSKYGEEEPVLHAVRAHHHDTPPSTPLAYLVISADAVSGSRPGARRFTEDSYNQKMASLERIIDSFENIEDAYIMSAGREMRVVVNDKKVSDKGALDLSRLIAEKIEKECSYPGLIKVTVVRRSEAAATA